MALSDLIVLNRRSTADAAAASIRLADACVVQTCLRQVQIGTRAGLDQGRLPAGTEDAFEVRNGAAAYGFLLRLACGLESAIPGETEILGQIKEAWREYEQQNALSARRLRPWLQRLLAETKEVRSEYIVGLGSATYGSLTRRLLGGRPTGTTLLVGAGQLAATVLPYLDGADLRIVNRSLQRAQEMVAAQHPVDASFRRMILDPSLDSELAAWREARDVVLCVPLDPERDSARVQAWLSRRGAGGRVLHLGIQNAAGTPWERIPDIACLDELFGLRDAQAGQRDALLARAQRACAEKSQLACLDDAAGTRLGSSNHGWEDLAVFQALGS
jgi:hypothetical protein